MRLLWAHDDISGHVVGGLLNFCSVKQGLVINDLEVDGYTVFFLERLNDLIDEEQLLGAGG